MKTNPNDLAFADFIYDESEEKHTCGGLTKREYFAAMAFQGFLSKPIVFVTAGTESVERLRWQMASDAVKAADTLIAQLNKSQEGEK